MKAQSVSGLLATSSKICYDGFIMSYNLSKLIANTGKAHVIGEELILPAIKEVLETVLHHLAASSVIKNIPLSNDTVRRRIDEIAEDVKTSLCRNKPNFQYKLMNHHCQEMRLYYWHMFGF